VFFSLEMTAEGIAARLLAWASGVSSVRLERQTATADEYARVGEAAATFDLPLTIETSATTVMEMRAWCRRAQREGPLACAVVDYLQLLVPDRHRESDEAEIAGISKALKRMAKELGIVVLAISQLSRAPEARKDKRPHTSDLRGSGTLEQDCDLALLLFREEMYTPKPENRGIAEVIVAKNRSGPTGVVRLAWVAELAMFGNLAQ
jgi:replicative DNA helicase